jgi:PIN domain nuclease of toxin-antitoxin system
VKYLLDTHTIIWFAKLDDQLPHRMLKLMEEETSECSVSIASLWEMTIKAAINKLTLGLSIQQFSLLLETRGMKFCL